MTNIIYVTAGEKLKKLGEQLVIIRESEEVSLHLKDIFMIIVETQQCSITVGAHLLCSTENVPLVICNQKHQPEVFCYSNYSYYRLTERLKEQMAWEMNEFRALMMAKIIKQKIIHQSDVLAYFKKNEYPVGLFEDYCLQLETTSERQVIETAEAVCARMYFTGLFGKQFKRQEEDVVNAGLNYGYMLIRAVIMNQIVAKGLHPSLGIFHQNQFNNYNLADDVIEVFRPMVDYIVVETLVHEPEFLKEHRLLLQQVLLQTFHYNGKVLDLKLTINDYLDSLLLAFRENNIERLVLPVLELNRYDYQK